MPDYTLPCQIGQRAFMIENHNRVQDKCPGYLTKYGHKIVIRPFRVEAFIIDEEGVSIAEGSHDGFNKLCVYHDLTLDKPGDAKVFFDLVEATTFVESIIDTDQPFNLEGGSI